jgi:hypothetical protein
VKSASRCHNPDESWALLSHWHFVEARAETNSERCSRNCDGDATVRAEE